MAIVWDPQTNLFVVRGRVGFHRSIRGYINSSTRSMQSLIPTLAGDPLGPTERAYNPGLAHNLQNTMRAHHIADHEIQLMVCDYMNGTINFPTLIDRLGTLYQTSWIDLIVTPRLFKIWWQWIRALTIATTTGLSSLVISRQRAARFATLLARELSSSVANLRIGHGPTDNRLGNAIAPRLRRGGMIDVVYYFMQYINSQSLRAPTLSFETSVAREVWNPHFVAHPFAPGNGYMAVGNVFAGPNAGGILISENTPPIGLGTVPIPQRYPFTQGLPMYVHRITRSSSHILPLLLIVWLLYSYLNIFSLGSFFGGGSGRLS